MFILTQKKCTKCGELKDRGEFRKDKSSKDGLRSDCKSCCAEYEKGFYSKRPGMRQEKNKAYRSKPGVLEKARERLNAWRICHPEKYNEYARKYNKKHPEISSVLNQNRRARVQGNGGEITLVEWNLILDKYGHKCLCCGRTDVKLTMDHVVPLFLGGKNTADNIQPLCGSCNSRKHTKVVDYR